MHSRPSPSKFHNVQTINQKNQEKTSLHPSVCYTMCLAKKMSTKPTTVWHRSKTHHKAKQATSLLERPRQAMSVSFHTHTATCAQPGDQCQRTDPSKNQPLATDARGPCLHQSLTTSAINRGQSEWQVSRDQPRMSSAPRCHGYITMHVFLPLQRGTSVTLSIFALVLLLEGAHIGRVGRKHWLANLNTIEQ